MMADEVPSDTFVTLTERAVALIARSRALDKAWSEREGGSATAIFWADEALEAEIGAFDRDARQALAEHYSTAQS